MAFGITLNLGLSTSGPLNVPLEIISAIIDTTQIPNPVTIIATGSGTVNWMVDSTASYASIADAEAALGSADSSGSFLSSDTGATVDNTGVSPDGSYFIHFWGDDGSVISQAYEVDNTAPVLTSQSASVVSGSIEVDVTSDTADGTIYAAVRLASDPELSFEDIANGTGDAVASQSDSSPIVGVNEFTFAGLPPGTYVVDIYQNDGRGNDSSIASTGSVVVSDSIAITNVTEVIKSSANTTSYTGSSVTAPSGSDRLRFLVVEFMVPATAPTTVSATIGGTSLTLLDSLFVNPGSGFALFYHKETSLPSGAVVVTTDNVVRACAATVVDFENVDQTTTIGATAKSSTAGTPVSRALTTTAANSIMLSGAVWRSEGATALPVTEDTDGTLRNSGETGTTSSNDAVYAVASEVVASASAETHTFSAGGGVLIGTQFAVEILTV